MTNINIAFSRALLTKAHKLVKRHYPDVGLMADAWVWNSGRNWEFHGPGKFYWSGRADNGYDARYKGWMAWLRAQGVTE